MISPFCLNGIRSHPIFRRCCPVNNATFRIGSQPGIGKIAVLVLRIFNMVRDAIASHLLIYIPSTIGPNKGSIRGSMSASNKPLRDLRFVRRTRLVLFTRAIISPTSRPRLALAELELYIKVILALVVLDSNHQASLYSLVISKGYLFLD